MIKLEEEFIFQLGEDYSFINPYSLGVVCQSLIYQECQRINFLADGIAIVAYVRLFKKRVIKRTSFDDTSLAPVVFHHACQNDLSIALIGGTQENIQQAKDLLESKYPGIRILLAEPGYFDNEDVYQNCIDKAVSADILIVGMGAGKQEKVLLSARAKGWQGTGFTCGGYLDQLVQARGDDYYPEFINKFHLRWLYRLLKEPRRLSKRYFSDYPYFLIKFGNKIE
ncbi:WecB/TagA/CpsF family glycosyltransferase [Halomonas sp. AOP27-A1-41]|uniref:WecB/TagA/CpsF family glycosyltransferase n=1 Tax=Halomonas sp. AOP27-A1-41 TaxID=3457707 RepID=UPI00403472B9